MIRTIILLSAEIGAIIFAIREFKGFMREFKQYTKAERKRRFREKHAAWEKTRKDAFYDVHSAAARDNRGKITITIKNPNIKAAFSKNFNVRVRL